MNSDYIHGTSNDEQARLSALNEVLNAGALARLALRPGDRVLDIGSGLGQLSRAMGRVCGPGCVVGVERDTAQLEGAQARARHEGEPDLVDFRAGNAEAPPLHEHEWGTFDVAHTRFVLEHVRDPTAIVAPMMRALRPGGRIVLEDDDHDVLRLWPEVPEAVAAWNAYMEMYRAMGYEPLIGRRMPSLVAAAGGEVTTIAWPFFGGSHGTPHFDALVENFIGILNGATTGIARWTGLGPKDVDDAVARLRQWKCAPGATLGYCTVWVEGKKRTKK